LGGRGRGGRAEETSSIESNALGKNGLRGEKKKINLFLKSYNGRDDRAKRRSGAGNSQTFTRTYNGTMGKISDFGGGDDLAKGRPEGTPEVSSLRRVRRRGEAEMMGVETGEEYQEDKRRNGVRVEADV